MATTHKPTEPSTNEDPTRARLTANVLDLITQWSAYRAKTRDSINGTMDCLISRVDWDHIEPEALLGACRAIMSGSPMADLQDLSDVADSERELLAPCVDEEALTKSDRIPESDAWLIYYTVEACQRHSCSDFVQEVSELPRGVRAKVSALLSELECPEGPGPHPNRGKLQARLVDAILDGGGSQYLADAYVLTPEEWTLRHVARPSLPLTVPRSPEVK